MGARAQVHIEDEGVYLYTHYGSQELPKDVANALDRGRDRWSDSEYLARVIFDEMKEDDIRGTTGYGIGTSAHGDLDYNPIEVNCKKRNVYHSNEIYTFEEFIEKFGV